MILSKRGVNLKRVAVPSSLEAELLEEFQFEYCKGSMIVGEVPGEVEDGMFLKTIEEGIKLVLSVGPDEENIIDKSEPAERLEGLLLKKGFFDASHVLAYEGAILDLFKTISESVEATKHVEADVSSVSGQDDVIGKLLDRMIQILPPEERNIFGETDDKNIEEIIEEANELIRATTPLFSSTDSGERSWNKTSKSLPKTSKTSDNSDRKRKDHVEVITSKKSESGTSSICSSMESIIVKDSLSHDLSEKGRNFQTQGSGSSEKLDKDILEIFSKQDKSYNSSFEKFLEGGRDMSPTHSDKENFSGDLSKKAINESNEQIRNNTDMKLKEQVMPKASTDTINTESQAETAARAKLENSYKASLDLMSKDPEAQIEALRQKYTTEIQDLKLAHNKEIYGLTKQITSLNDKIFELQKHSEIEQNPDLKTQEIERLENEIKSQEQLISGYERENKKLCKEILNLKEGWKQRESRLLEEKQRLQCELQGMVAKTTTDALQEQLKDARETIVKLQIEVTSYKSKNKELEMACDRLRGETQSLQRELSHCRCDRASAPRRDKYSQLASVNVGSQILELKNVIARKDIEIAQMNTTLRILKGELSNREVTPMSPSPPGTLEEHSQQLELTVSQLQTSLAVERQNYRDLAKEKDNLLKENLDLKRQVRELESIVKRRQRSDSCFPVAAPDPQTTARLAQLERELTSRQESLTTLHGQFIKMQKKYEHHIEELENRLKESRDEIQTMKVNMKKEEANQKITARRTKLAQPAKEETHLLATIRGLRQEVATKEKDINKLNKEMEELRQTNRKLQKEREKQLNAMPAKMGLLREKPNLKKGNTMSGSRTSITSPNNNIDPILFAELQESNLFYKSKNKSLQEDVKRLEQDLIAMHNKRVHDLNMLQSEHELETARLVEERAALIAQSSSSGLEGQLYTQQMVINHLKNRLKQMEELKNEVTMLRAERDHLEQRLSVVNKEMCYLQNATAHSPESIQYKTLLEKLETLEKNQEIREQKLNAVRELLSRSTQGQGQCSGTCRDKLLDKNRQICFYRAQMDRILEALVEIRRTK